MKITLEEKLRNVKLHLEENVPIYEIQKSYGQNSTSLKYYCHCTKNGKRNKRHSLLQKK